MGFVNTEEMKPGVLYTTPEAYEWFKKEYARLYDYFVYILTSPDGKKYVGYGKGNPEKRWANGNGYGHNKALNTAIKEYGWENFLHVVFRDGLCIEEAQELERRLILKIESYKPEIGYNRHIPKEEILRSHYSVYMLIFPDQKKYVGRTGRPFEKRWDNGYGFQHEKELYAAIRECGWENVIKLRCLEDVPEESAIAFEEFLIRVNHTTDPSRGYNKSVGGKVESGWKRSEETKRKTAAKLKGRKNSEATRQKMRQSASSRAYPVLNVDTGETYPSQNAAARALGVDKSLVSACLRGKFKHVKGYTLCRLEKKDVN